MMTTYLIDYQSGVESMQDADSPIDALRCEFIAAYAEIPEFVECYSGESWQFCVYPEGVEKPYEKTYFIQSRGA